MQIYAITRGVIHDVNLMITQLQGKYFPFKGRLGGDANSTTASKELKDYALAVGVRPIQLWEIAYPVAYHDHMCSTLFGETRPDSITNWRAMGIKALQTGLNIKKINYTYDANKVMPLYKNNVEIAAVGQKEDYWRGKNDEVLDHYEEGAFEGI